MLPREELLNTEFSRFSLNVKDSHRRGSGGFPSKRVAAAPMPARFWVEVAELYQTPVGCYIY